MQSTGRHLGRKALVTSVALFAVGGLGICGCESRLVELREPNGLQCPDEQAPTMVLGADFGLVEATRTEFGPNGRPIRMTLTDDRGVRAQEILTDYTPEGRLESQDMYLFGDHIDARTYKYESQSGSEITTETCDGCGTSSVDEVPDLVFAKTYRDGLLVTEVVTDLGTGDELRRETRAYDSESRVEEVLREAGGVASLETFGYDMSGNFVLRELDVGLDGSVQERNVRTHDSANRLIRDELDRGAPTVDGLPERIVTYTYDAEGRTLTTSVDSDADGNTDTLTSWNYDESGDITIPIDSDGDMELDSVEVRYFDVSGRLSRRDWDRSEPARRSVPGQVVDTCVGVWELDGSVDERVDYVYDSDGRRVEEVTSSHKIDVVAEVCTPIPDAGGLPAAFYEPGCEVIP